MVKRQTYQSGELKMLNATTTLSELHLHSVVTDSESATESADSF